MRKLSLFPHPFDARSAVLITQWLFFGLLVLSLLAVGITDPAQLISVSALAGVLIALAVTLAMTILRPELTPTRAWFYLVPLLDGVAVAVLQLELGSGASIATLLTLIVPATWLGTSGRAWSIVLAFLMGALAVSSDLLRAASVAPGVPDTDVASYLMVPGITAVAALFGYQLVDEAASASTSELHARRTRDAIVDTVDVGMIVLDGDGAPIIVNRALREHPVFPTEGMTPYAAVRSIPSFEADRVTPHTPDREPLIRAMTDEGLTEELFWARGRDGETSYAFLANSRRLFDDDGELEGTVVVFTDVTEYLEAVRSRDRLISSVSHELRTPLTVLRGFVELARETHGPQSDELAGYLSIIERNIDREHVIVDQLILAAQSHQEHTTSSPVATDLELATVSAVDAFRHEATAKSLTLQRAVEPGNVTMDPRLFRLVAEALIANAVRFTPRGGFVAVEAHLAPASVGQGERVRIVVRDSGVGISADDLSRIYDPFFRTEAAIRSSAPGMGLGLAVLKSILDSRHGTIQVDSSPGHGTTVTVEIPVDNGGALEH